MLLFVEELGGEEVESGFWEAGSGFGWLAVCVAGSGSERVPVTMSASQSPKPPGAASTAV